MFDFRYHIASLAAVFIALVLGILVGVAISGKGFVDKSERRVLQGQIRALRQERDAANARANDLRNQQDSSQTVISATYPALMRDRLKGKKVAVLVIGPSGGETGRDVDNALSEAGGTELRYRALKVPVDIGAIRKQLASTVGLRAFSGEGRLDDLGRELGAELVTGGKTPLWDALARILVERQRGGLDRPVDGVVVIRAAKPQSGPTASFLTGLYDGLGSAGVAAIGAETLDAETSAVKQWKRGGLSSVDDIDTLPGRLALALVLAGASRGQYGMKPTAENGPLPKLAAA